MGAASARRPSIAVTCKFNARLVRIAVVLRHERCETMRGRRCAHTVPRVRCPMSATNTCVTTTTGVISEVGAYFAVVALAAEGEKASVDPRAFGSVLRCARMIAEFSQLAQLARELRRQRRLLFGSS